MVIHNFSIISVEQFDTPQEPSNHLWVIEKGCSTQPFFFRKKKNPQKTPTKPQHKNTEKTPKFTKASLIFQDPWVTVLPEETSYLKLWRVCAHSWISFSSDDLFYFPLMILFRAQGTQRCFCLQSIWSCTETHRFYPISEGFCFAISSHWFKIILIFFWWDVFSSLKHQGVELGSEDSCPANTHVGFCLSSQGTCPNLLLLLFTLV